MIDRDWLEDGFKEGLNHQFGSVIIAEQKFNAADILKECDRFHYDILFTEYMMEMRESEQ